MPGAGSLAVARRGAPAIRLTGGVSNVPSGWFRRPEDRTGALHYWDGHRWTGATRPPGRPRPLRGSPAVDPVRVLWACLGAIVAITGFVAVVLTLKGALAALVLILVGTPVWLAWRRRRAARSRR